MDALREILAEHGLRAAGAFIPDVADGLPDEVQAVIMLAPDEPHFWIVFTSSPEWTDGHADPLDSWSARVIGEIAEASGAKPLFPFTDPPFRPFYKWAIKAGACASPVMLLADGTAGLFASFRGALAFDKFVQIATLTAPCSTCERRSCLSSCPVDALNAGGYDTAKCAAYLRSPAGSDCLEMGCRVRRSCHVGSANRPADQSAYSLQEFLRCRND
ncbi:ferredoxin [Marivivens donghaensis]|uniref:Ferredoxin n=1 Tax=Marivivens donghaensis TaxID=1699413 RepID=A0ABX0VYS8_9RHOB|nr:ferredoxin [Marivivens donghaensis]NIY71802.1 ferredoxin [Marivivens donghaensis]